MSFSSAEWTIPELCVWISTRDAARFNALSEMQRHSLHAADRVVPGAWKMRDEIVRAAIRGAISATCIRPREIGLLPDPPGTPARRVGLEPGFWNKADVIDVDNGLTGASVCIARFRHGADHLDHHALRVSREEALAEWPSPGQRKHPNAINDEIHVAAILKGMSDGSVKSVLNYVQQHAGQIAGQSEAAKVHRLQNKVKARRINNTSDTRD